MNPLSFVTPTIDAPKPATPVRVVVWIWDRGVEDFATYCLPSLLQPDNLPWLVRNGYELSLDFFTHAADAPRVQALAIDLDRRLHEVSGNARVTTSLAAVQSTGESAYEIKTKLFENFVGTAVSTKSHVLLAFADMYYGNGSIRNIVTYGRKPRVSVGGLYLRVKREPFTRLLAHHKAVTGSETISNARLVDICMDCLIDGMQASIVDQDRNASYLTSGAIRKISDDLYTYTFHAPTPFLFYFEEQDALFFSRFRWNFHFLDHIWPTMLIAQNRWRVMASSDLFFVAELNPEDVEAGQHTYPVQEGMLYNDEFFQEHLHGRYHQTMLMALRRERLPEGARPSPAT